ncbi:MAG: hypothetical protein GX334_09245 [Firmicutes bacterium]|nr:hypothetical protein [Bacillota bacterium]
MQPDKTNAKSEKVTEKKSRPFFKKNLLLIALVVVAATALLSVGALAVAVKMGFASPLLNGLLGVHTREAAVKEPAYMYAVPEVLVNLPEGGRRFLSVKFYLGYDEPKLKEELDKRMPEIRDVVNKTLWTKTVEEMSTAEGKENLREEILGAINDLLQKGELRGLYFWHVLVQ